MGLVDRAILWFALIGLSLGLLAVSVFFFVTLLQGGKRGGPGEG